MKAWARHERNHHEVHGDQLWRKVSATQRTLIGAPKASTPWTQRKGVKLTGVVPNCPRQLDLIDLAWEARLAEARGGRRAEDLAVNYFVDLSQSAARKPWKKILCNFRANGHIYSYQTDTCLTGEDELRLLGWPRFHLAGVSPIDLLELAGSSGSVPLATIVMTGVVFNPWGSWNHGEAP